MYINKQTLFNIYNKHYNTYKTMVSLFDLKTLTILDFEDTKEAIKFCAAFGESECIDELHNGIVHMGDYLYLDTNKESKWHRVVNIYSKIKIAYIDSSALLFYVRNNKVYNLTTGKNEKIRIKWYVPITEDSFKKRVEGLYRNFINSTRLLGNKQGFKYEIIGKYVIQTNTTEPEDIKEVYVPEFVTSLSSYPYYYPKVFKVSDGVKFIGANVLDKETKIIGGNSLKYIGNMYNSTDVQIIRR